MSFLLGMLIGWGLLGEPPTSFWAAVLLGVMADVTWRLLRSSPTRQLRF